MSKMYGILFLALIGLGSGCSQSKPLFNGHNLDGWTEIGSTGAWCAEDGILKCNGKKEGYAWLSTCSQYADFELTLECRFGAQANTGVFCRAPDREGRTSMKGFEVQLRDDSADKDNTDLAGAIFNRVPAAGRFSHWPGEWNRLSIICCQRHVHVELNGHVTVAFDMDAVPAKGEDPPMSAVPDCGYIGLQNHGTPAEFRNICIREFDSKKCTRCTFGS